MGWRLFANCSVQEEVLAWEQAAVDAQVLVEEQLLFVVEQEEL